MRTYFMLIISLLISVSTSAQVFTKKVKPFEKVIVSPHISVIFEKGTTEEVIVEDINVSREKLIFEQKGSTLHIYLEGAKTYTKSETEKGNDYKVKRPIYNGTVVRAKIIYKTLNDLSLRGEERFVLRNKLTGEKFRMKIYGESNIHIYDVNVGTMNLTTYGESVVRFKSGNISKLKITAYGESRIKAMDVNTREVKVTAYGEAEVRVQVAELLKVTAYGEADIRYSGSARVQKGVVIGDASVEKIN